MTGTLHRLRAAIGDATANVFQYLGVWLSCGLAAAVSALVFFGWLADEVLEGSTQAFDESVRSFIHAHASPVLTFVMRLLTMLGSTTWLTAMGVCIAIGFLIVGWRRGVVLFALTMAGATVLNLTLKYSFGRARPSAFFETPLPSSYSFPSGHALFALCFYGALAAIVAPRLRHLAARIIVWTVVALLIVLIGLSRIYLGVHYPSDVLAGYAAALVWVVMVAFGDYMLRIGHDEFKRKNDF